MESDELIDQPENVGTGKIYGASSVLAMGILSIIFISLIGLLLAFATISKANRLTQQYGPYRNKYPEKYFNRIKAGKYCAIGGLLLKTIGVLILVALNN